MEQFSIFGPEEGALVMVEPPGELWIGRIFEVDDGIDVAIEHGIGEELVSRMGHTRVGIFCIGVASFLEETGKKGRASSPVKAVIVVENSYFHQVGSESIGKPISMLQTGYKNQP